MCGVCVVVCVYVCVVWVWCVYTHIWNYVTAEAEPSCTSDAGEQMMQFRSEYKGLRTRRADGVSSSPKVSNSRARKRRMFSWI